jgi:hypothetical protein
MASLLLAGVRFTGTLVTKLMLLRVNSSKALEQKPRKRSPSWQRQDRLEGSNIFPPPSSKKQNTKTFSYVNVKVKMCVLIPDRGGIGL